MRKRRSDPREGDDLRDGGGEPLPVFQLVQPPPRDRSQHHLERPAAPPAVAPVESASPPRLTTSIRMSSKLPVLEQGR